MLIKFLKILKEISKLHKISIKNILMISKELISPQIHRTNQELLQASIILKLIFK